LPCLLNPPSPLKEEGRLGFEGGFVSSIYSK